MKRYYSLMYILFFLKISSLSASFFSISNAFDKSDTSKLSHYMSKANAFAKEKQPDSAIVYYIKAIGIYRVMGDTANGLKTSYHVIRQYHEKKDDSSALVYDQNIYSIYNNYLINNPLIAAEYFYHLGREYQDNLLYNSSIISLQKSLKLWFDFGKDSIMRIKNVFNELAWDFFQTGKFDSSIIYSQKEIEVCASKYGYNNPVTINSLGVIGNSYSEKGELDSAVEYYQKALKVSLNIPGCPETELSGVYYGLGIIYYIKKDYNIALIYLEKALNLFIQTNGEESSQAAFCYSSIGVCYEESRMKEKAYFYYEKALKIRIALLGENHPEVVESYINLGNLCADFKDYAKELIYNKKALAICLNLFDESRSEVETIYMNMGATYTDIKEYDSAFYYNKKALNICQKYHPENIEHISSIYSNIGETYLAQQKYDSALFCFQKAIQIIVPDFKSINTNDNPELKQIADYPNTFQMLYQKATALYLKYFYQNKNSADLEQCITIYKLMSQIADRFYHQLREEGSKLFAAGEARDAFNDAVKVCCELYKQKNDNSYNDLAFYFAEKGKAAVLLDAMEESSAQHFAGIPENLLLREKRLNADKENCETGIKELQAQKVVSDSSQIKKLENELFSITLQHQQLVDTFETLYPEYMSLRNMPKPLSPAEITSKLNDHTAILEYLSINDSLFIFTFTSKGFHTTIVQTDSAFKLAVKEYPQSIKKLKTFSFVEKSQLLYKYLIASVEGDILNKEQIIIIPDDNLFYIPFETLVSNKVTAQTDFSKLDYLIKNHDISYHYSANLWLHSQNPSKSSSGKIEGFIGFAPVFKKDSKQGSIIAANVAFPDSTSEETAMRSVTSDGKKFNELLYTEQEIKSIVSLFEKNKQKAVGYLYSEANETNFKTKIRQYKYVHIASHGFANDNEPKLSGIAFYQANRDNSLKGLPSEINENNEGILFSSEAYNLNLNADLVVLSACESGTGKLMKGEGMMALTRGFLFAGTPNIVYSLWKVGDQNTQQLMVDFYSNILAGNNYAHSLRLAKLDMLKNEKTAFPKFWSGFELVGK